ncbi:MAG: SDR family NAD(P)-dependent oxidoreductase [Bacteroidales bacterium]|nr:SDR family NAD(P)-dependent oxidoreductase [Bacteroidales bacterium]
MKKAIIIGATSGIGNELAKLLVNNNYRVGITGRRTGLLADLKQVKPDSFIVRTFDITETQTTVQNLEELTKELGGLDLLFISSGTGDLNDHLDFSVEKSTIDTNVTGFTCVADWAFNYFENQKHGHLVAITSVAGLRGSRQAPAYNATKAYQINYLESLRQKAKHLRFPILVTDIRPGFVKTNMAKGEGQFWVATVEKAAKQIFIAIRNKRKVAYITHRWRLVAILLQNIPRAVFDRF